jgi:glycosyltransferase involved in cell wall biosynthesis
MITITYITITYNAAAVLRRTLDSVLRQDYPHIRHLIIDGASTDNTLKIVDDYISRSNALGRSASAADGHYEGHDVQVTSEPDNGIYDAMNKGLRSATGDYVCFLNAGDFLPADDTASRIASQLEGMEQLPAVLYGDTDIVDNDGNYLFHRRLHPPEHLTWKSFRQGMLVCHQAFYARTDFAVANPFDQRYRFSADVDWCIRIMRQAEQERVPLHNLHMVVANYTQEGQTTLHHRESLVERYKVMQSHYGRVQTFLLHCWFVVRLLFT